jgi:hypothetical protein
MDWMGEIEFCPEWLHIPDKYKLLMGFKWADKRGYREYRYIPSNWKEEWEIMKGIIERDKKSKRNPLEDK